MNSHRLDIVAFLFGPRQLVHGYLTFAYMFVQNRLNNRKKTFFITLRSHVLILLKKVIKKTESTK